MTILTVVTVVTKQPFSLKKNLPKKVLPKNSFTNTKKKHFFSPRKKFQKKILKKKKFGTKNLFF